MDTHREIKKSGQWPPALTPVEQFPKKMSDRHITETLPIGLMNTTGTYLNQLNEDCLLEIFSQNSLTAMDLLSLAETCELFKRVAQRLFPKRLAIYKDNRKYSITANNDVVIIGGVQIVKRILKNFGSILVALKVKHATSVMKSVAKHCVVGTLRELELSWIEMTAPVAVEFKPIFQQLQKLTINYAVLHGGAHVFANCDSLSELSVIGRDRYDGIMENNFPKLQRFTFESRHYVSDSELNFLGRHKTLKFLHLPTLDFKAIEDFLPKLGNSCKELEELNISRIKCHGSTTLNLSNFQNLKRLDLRFPSKGDEIVRLQNASYLEVLGINGWFRDKKIVVDIPFLKK